METWLGEWNGFSENCDSENVDLRECFGRLIPYGCASLLFVHANFQDLEFVVSELFNNNKSDGSRDEVSENKKWPFNLMAKIGLPCGSEPRPRL